MKLHLPLLLLLLWMKCDSHPVESTCTFWQVESLKTVFTLNILVCDVLSREIAYTITIVLGFTRPGKHHPLNCCFDVLTGSSATWLKHIENFLCDACLPVQIVWLLLRHVKSFTSVVGLFFFLQNFGPWWRPVNAICHSVNIDGVVILLACAAGLRRHLNTTYRNQTWLSFLHREVVGTQKFSFAPLGIWGKFGAYSWHICRFAAIHGFMAPQPFMAICNHSRLFTDFYGYSWPFADSQYIYGFVPYKPPGETFTGISFIFSGHLNSTSL